MASPTYPSSSAEYLRATLWVEPSPDGGCGVVGLDERPEQVTQNLVSGTDAGPTTGRDCCAEVTVAGEGSNRFIKRRTDSNCICPVFSAHDCVATIDGVEDGQFVVSLSVPDREELASIVEALRERGATPRLRRITSARSEQGSRLLELEADSITDRQREAVEVAVESGYYERPRRADLGDLADALDISRSAVSQRLSAVESKLVDELFRAQRGLQETA